MKPCQIHTLHRPAAKPNGQLLASSSTAATWTAAAGTSISPRFNAGYDCVALDLSGHGQSEGRERLDRFGLMNTLTTCCR